MRQFLKGLTQKVNFFTMIERLEIDYDRKFLPEYNEHCVIIPLSEIERFHKEKGMTVEANPEIQD